MQLVSFYSLLYLGYIFFLNYLISPSTFFFSYTMYSFVLDILFLIVLFFSFEEQFLFAFLLSIVLLYIIIRMTMIPLSSFSIPLYCGKN